MTQWILLCGNPHVKGLVCDIKIILEGFLYIILVVTKTPSRFDLLHDQRSSSSNAK